MELLYNVIKYYTEIVTYSNMCTLLVFFLCKTLVHEIGHYTITLLYMHLFVNISPELKYVKIDCAFPTRGVTNSGVYQYLSDKSPNIVPLEKKLLTHIILAGIVNELLFFLIVTIKFEVNILFISTLMLIILIPNIICLTKGIEQNDLTKLKLLYTNNSFYYEEQNYSPTKKDRLLVGILFILIISMYLLSLYMQEYL